MRVSGSDGPDQGLNCLQRQTTKVFLQNHFFLQKCLPGTLTSGKQRI